MEGNKEKTGKAFILTGNPKALKDVVDIDLENATQAEMQEGLQRIIQRWIEPADTRHKERKPDINKVIVAFEKGKTPHAHALIVSRNEIKLDSVAARFKGWHIEPMRGTFKQARDYMYKTGDYAVKAKTKLTEPLEWGEYEPPSATPTGQRLYELVAKYVNEGLSPSQIYLTEPKLAMHSKMVESYYGAYVQKSIPAMRNVEVIWSFGAAGTGKSYQYIQWCEEVGKDCVYFASCTTNNVFDGYEEGRHTHIVLDELRANSFRLSELLQILDSYPAKLGCRYRDRTAAYSHVLITTPLSPEALYTEMSKSKSSSETLEQLLRRIDVIKYCYIDTNEKGTAKYKSVSVKTQDYQGEQSLIELATLDGEEGEDDER